MKKMALVLSILAVSSLSFSATKKATKVTTKATTTAAPAKAATIEQKMDQLDDQIEALRRKEQAKRDQQAMAASTAQDKIDTLISTSETVDERIADIEAGKGTFIFKKEFNTKLGEYKKINSEIAKDVKSNQKIVDEYELIKDLEIF